LQEKRTQAGVSGVLYISMLSHKEDIRNKNIEMRTFDILNFDRLYSLAIKYIREFDNRDKLK